MLLVIDTATGEILGQLTRRIDLGGGIEALTYMSRGGRYCETTSWTAHVEVV